MRWYVLYYLCFCDLLSSIQLSCWVWVIGCYFCLHASWNTHDGLYTHICCACFVMGLHGFYCAAREIVKVFLWTLVFHSVLHHMMRRLSWPSQIVTHKTHLGFYFGKRKTWLLILWIVSFLVWCASIFWFHFIKDTILFPTATEADIIMNGLSYLDLFHQQWKMKCIFFFWGLDMQNTQNASRASPLHLIK